MDTSHTADIPTRVAIFDSVGQADRAVHRLLEAGFSKENLGILCSSQCQGRPLAALPAALPGKAPTKAIATGGAVGATIGGLALAATSAVTGGAALLAAGVLVGGAALAGTFAGAMASLGYAKTTTDYCEQAVREGNVVVSASAYGEGSAAMLDRAEGIFAETEASSVLALPLKI